MNYFVSNLMHQLLKKIDNWFSVEICDIEDKDILILELSEFVTL